MVLWRSSVVRHVSPLRWLSVFLRFNWTDGKLNSSNLMELSGQITESFDEEFRILYAQSLPVNTSVPSSVRNSGMYDHLLLLTPGTPKGRAAIPMPVCLTSTPSKAHTQQNLQIQQNCTENENEGRKSSSVSDSSTLGEDLIGQEVPRDVITTEEPPGLSALQIEKAESTISVRSVGVMAAPASQIHHVSTQTSSTAHSVVQTETPRSPCSSFTSNSSPSQDSLATQVLKLHPQVPGSNLREYFGSQVKERQLHYSAIRSKLHHMMLLLAHRREQVDVRSSLSSNMPRACRGPHHAAFTGTGSDVRGLHWRMLGKVECRV